MMTVVGFLLSIFGSDRPGGAQLSHFSAPDAFADASDYSSSNESARADGKGNDDVVRRIPTASPKAAVSPRRNVPMRRAMYSLLLVAVLAGMLTGCRRYSGLCDICADPDPCLPKSLFYAGVNCGGCGAGGCFSGGGCAGGNCANGACGGGAVSEPAGVPVDSLPSVTTTPKKL